MTAELAALAWVRRDVPALRWSTSILIGDGAEAAGGPLAGAVRAAEPGAGLCVISGVAELGGLVVVLPHLPRRAISFGLPGSQSTGGHAIEEDVMGELVVNMFTSLDGVLQGPGA